MKNLNEYYDKHNYDNKELKLADKLINTTNKEENQIIVKNIEKNIDKLHKMDDDEWVDLYDTANLILDFNGRY